MVQKFNLVSDYPPQGDQPQAIKKLVEGIRNGYKHQTLLGVTGSGKTFTMANVIQKVQLPTLVISHNKTLAAQLCSEFRRYFPDNAVEYFVSYYDYYQPEAYIARTDTYIEKDSSIKEELIERLKYFKKEGKLLEAQRLEQRTKYDLEMLKEVGYCSGIENYSRHISGRKPGEPPATLLDYFPSDFIMFIDESHVTIPQLRGMFAGDKSRKNNLVEYGFRLPSAYDNRPLYFKEIENYMEKVVLVSATPAKYELEKSKQIVEQIIRPTGLIDPEIILKPAKNQIDSLIAEIKKRTEKKERVLVTTLTKRMAEDVAEYLEEINIKAKYLHSEIKTLERINILKDLRLGKFNVLVGVNLLREGLDLPEVSLVAILDADKEGFLRSETSLIQTMGRAARNINGTVILYCENITGSIERAMEETNRRRKIQLAYNQQYHIIPQTIIKSVDNFSISDSGNNLEDFSTVNEEHEKYLSQNNLWLLIKSLEKEMKQAAKNLDFERAALLRDEIRRLKKEKTLFGGKISGSD